MEYNYMSFLTDFCFMSLLLVIAQFMRAKIQVPADVLHPASSWPGYWDYCRPQFLDLIPWAVRSASMPGVCVLFRRSVPGQEERPAWYRWAIPSASI